MFLPGEQDRTRYMARQQVVRVADVRFVIDQLAHLEALSPPLRGGRIDASKVAVIGHSFGGAASIAALSEDPRVVAAANIDGTPYGDLPDRTLNRPFLLLQSDQAETHHGDRFNTGNGKLLATMDAPGFRYEIKHANHYSFTDAPFFFAPPGRWLLAQVMGGGRGPVATQQATADILEAFSLVRSRAQIRLGRDGRALPGGAGRRGGAQAGCHVGLRRSPELARVLATELVGAFVADVVRGGRDRRAPVRSTRRASSRRRSFWYWSGDAQSPP